MCSREKWLYIFYTPLERTYLLQVLTATRGNVSRAAALSGKYRGDFYKLLHKHGLVPESFREE